MSKARDEIFKLIKILDSEDAHLLNGIRDAIEELEQLLKECVVDKDILKYDNMKLEQQKAELIESYKYVIESGVFESAQVRNEIVNVLNKYKESE